MSLIITSNTALADEASTSVGLNAPSSYVNNLQGALRIPENAEIAVQSVKLSKTGNLTIPASGLAFGFYFGRNFEEEQSDMNISTSLMVPEFVGPPGEILNVEQIANESSKTFNKVLWHPNLLENASATINPGASCIVKRNASNDFVGFEFGATNSSSGQNQATNKPTTFINTEFGSTVVPTFIGDVLTNPATSTTSQSFIGTTFPLSLAGGSFSCSLGNSSLGEWSVGLSRCSRTTDYLGNPSDLTTPSKFEYVGGGGFQFYDYVVRAEPQGTNFVIKAYHCIADNDEDKLIMAQINYGTPIFGPTETIHEVIWEVKGERVACFLKRTNGTSITLLDGITAGKLAKPVNMMTRFLFPKVSLEVDKNVKIIGFTGVNVINFVYGDATSNATSPDDWLYQDYYSYLRNNGTTAIAPSGDPIAEQYELYNVNNIAGGFADQIGLSAGGLINYPLGGINLCFEDNYGLSDNPADPNNPAIGFVLSGNLNSAEVYGFEGNGTPNPPALTTPLLWTSSDIPVLKNTNSLFIRLKNMTFDSANFSVANMSKILYHIPAFSNNGESTGSLFFEPSERVYLKLNNPREFEMTTIEVDIVNSNETISRDLLGKTVVVFHIRQSK